jgi:hypothetical protein
MNTSGTMMQADFLGQRDIDRHAKRTTCCIAARPL